MALCAEDTHPPSEQDAAPPLCPKSKPSTAWHVSDSERHLFFDKCKSWDCEHCRPQKIARLVGDLKDAMPTRFVTLTTKATSSGCPHAEHVRATTRIPRLFKRMDGDRPKTEYFRVIELTKRGWPHYHFLTRGNYWDQEQLSREWKRLTGAFIVDVRKIKGKNLINYVTKYVVKGFPIEWARRRFSASRGFWRRPPTKKAADYVGWSRPMSFYQSSLVERWAELGSEPLSKSTFRPNEANEFKNHPSLRWWLYRGYDQNSDRSETDEREV